VVFFTLRGLIGSGWIACFLLGFVFFLFLLVALAVALPVVLAKGRAIRQQKEEIPLFCGLVKLILWEANQGLVLLRNKRISAVIYGPRDGGTKFIFPVIGDELRVRVPLTLRLTQFEDRKVLTRESMQLRLKVAIWWRIADLQKYYYLIDKQVHVMTERFQHDWIAEALPAGVQADARAAQQGAAEKWMLTIAESCIHKLVSQSTTAFLVSKQASSYLHVEDQHRPVPSNVPPGAPTDPPETAATPTTLPDEIHQMLHPKVSEYGLEIDRVEIQEVSLSEEIQRALNAVFTATLKPAQTEQEARAEQIRLQAAASVLGVETVALTEVMKQFKGSTYVGGMPKFIELLFAQTLAQGKKGAAALPGGGTGGAVIP
jgi:regulator of protease activity HflC (stomatin/prohibitin superfamily)